MDPTDTTILTRLGNLLVREHRAEEALRAFEAALAVDDGMYNVWFNAAHAQIALKDIVGARQSLQNALSLKVDLHAARHMLQALSDEVAGSVQVPFCHPQLYYSSKHFTHHAFFLQHADPAYVKELYDSYASNYDEHGKKLRYASPRVIREEMAKIYQTMGRFEGEGNELGTEDEGGETCAPSSMGSSEGGCSSHPHVQLTAGPLDVLDLGCGTGLAGGWIKDYCKRLVGVDLSAEMIAVAKKKALYQEMHVMSINEYMSSTDEKFDLVVAADVFSYIGDLSQTFSQLSRVLRPGSHAAFTIEAIPSGIECPEKGFTLLKNGRFGYTQAYIDGLVKGNGLEVELSKDFSPRLDFGEPVPGYLFVVKSLSS